MTEEIPLPLSKKLMKKLETNRDFKTHSFNVWLTKRITTSSRHYAVPLGQRARMDKIQKGDLKVMLVAKTIDITNIRKLQRNCIHSFCIHFPRSQSNLSLMLG